MNNAPQKALNFLFQETKQVYYGIVTLEGPNLRNSKLQVQKAPIKPAIKAPPHSLSLIMSEEAFHVPSLALKTVYVLRLQQASLKKQPFSTLIVVT